MQLKQFRHWIGMLPSTLIAAAFAIGLSVTWFTNFYLTNDFELHANPFPEPLRVFFLPGMWPWYVVGVTTNSLILAWVSFFAGMLAFFGLIGATLDICIAIWRKKFRRLD